jgi:hypothetical protein
VSKLRSAFQNYTCFHPFEDQSLTDEQRNHRRHEHLRVLSIKYGSIGGSGKGSFVDSDKFKESDLNIFISVKVINQSINIKDALVYQVLSSVDDTNFTQVFGDCFISGASYPISSLENEHSAQCMRH